jgi:hypothetical protein
MTDINTHTLSTASIMMFNISLCIILFNYAMFIKILRL